MRYRAKPVEIEASRFLGGFSVDEMGDEWGAAFADVAHYDDRMNALTIATLEGDMVASVGDYIIRGTHGEFYPCKSDVFQHKYEPSN